jgi:hypothetical protein
VRVFGTRWNKPAGRRQPWRNDKLVSADGLDPENPTDR